jgi:hypothetical protein
MTRGSREKHAQANFDCAECGAKKGEPCITSAEHRRRIGTRPFVHSARRDARTRARLAIEQQAKDPTR